MRRFGCLSIAVLLAVSLASCRGPSATVQIHLSTKRAEAGQLVKGTLVVDNPRCLRRDTEAVRPTVCSHPYEGTLS
jgi:hypothetical protein